jgi:membrane protein DedA with SNARE-associated domain
LGGLALLFPTDLTSFLDLIRQHGDAAYSLMFAYAASHSLLLALFAGYAAHSGALDLGTLIAVFAGSAVSPATSFASGSGGAMAPACSIVSHGSNAPCRPSSA